MNRKQQRKQADRDARVRKALRGGMVSEEKALYVTRWNPVRGGAVGSGKRK